MKTELDLYIEWNKVYDKAISKLMRISNKKLIEITKEETIKTANEYASKLTQQHYIDCINENIRTINEKF